MNRRVVLKFIIFLAGGICFLWMITPIFKAKWIDTNFAVTTEWDGFYEEPEESVNVLYIGSSHIMAGINPLEIWQEYGITGYICGSTKISLPAAYVYLKEGLRTQKPEVVVLDVSRLFQYYDNAEYEEDSRRALDYVKWSAAKREAVDALVQGDEKQSEITYLFPFFRYHSRWQELTEEDFAYLFRERHCAEKGMSMRFDRSGFGLPEDFMEREDQDAQYQMDAVSIQYFEKIVQLCREENIELLLVKIPSYNWNLKRHELSEQLAELYGVPFLDYTMPEMRKATGFIGKEDFVDEGDHLNTFGANKISAHLGRYLTENYIFKKHTEEAVQREWQSDYQQYALWKEAASLTDEDNLIYYLELADNPDYILVMASRFDCTYRWNGEIADSMKRLGLTEDLMGKYKCSYAAVIDGGRAVSERMAENDEACLSFSAGNVEIQVISQGAEVGNSASIRINGEEYAAGTTGLNVAVYDKRLGAVVDTKCFNTHSKNYHRKS